VNWIWWAAAIGLALAIAAVGLGLALMQLFPPERSKDDHRLW